MAPSRSKAFIRANRVTLNSFRETVKLNKEPLYIATTKRAFPIHARIHVAIFRECFFKDQVKASFEAIKDKVSTLNLGRIGPRFDGQFMKEMQIMSIHGFIRYEDNANVDQTILEITETFNEMGKIILNFLDAHNAQIPHLDSTPRVEVENRALASLFTQLMGCAPMPTRDDLARIVIDYTRKEAAEMRQTREQGMSAGCTSTPVTAQSNADAGPSGIPRTPTRTGSAFFELPTPPQTEESRRTLPSTGHAFPFLAVDQTRPTNDENEDQIVADPTLASMTASRMIVKLKLYTFALWSSNRRLTTERDDEFKKRSKLEGVVRQMCNLGSDIVSMGTDSI